MDSDTWDEFLQELEEYLAAHPCDPQYEKAANSYDGILPMEQSRAYFAREVLEQYKYNKKPDKNSEE